ncbi:hypothetical protein GCM10009610_30130 [Pseudonocardia xinjiangensis]
MAGDVEGDVVASLVLHYLEDWTAPLAELRRVLRPGGRLIASVEHPFVVQMLAEPGADYFATREYPYELTVNGQTAVLSLWYRPLHAMDDAFTGAGAGFRITGISEPPRHRVPVNCSPRSSRRGPREPSCASCSSFSRPTDAVSGATRRSGEQLAE